CTLLEGWRAEKERAAPGFCWLRSLRPPPDPLGSAPWVAFRGHEGHVHSVAVSPDGKRLVSGGSEGTVRIWDAETGAERLWQGGPGAAVERVAFSPDGRHVASSGRDRTARVWDASTGTEVRRLDLPACVWSVAFSPGGDRLAGGLADRTVWVWDVGSG